MRSYWLVQPGPLWCLIISKGSGNVLPLSPSSLLSPRSSHLSNCLVSSRFLFPLGLITATETGNPRLFYSLHITSDLTQTNIDTNNKYKPGLTGIRQCTLRHIKTIYHIPVSLWDRKAGLSLFQPWHALVKGVRPTCDLLCSPCNITASNVFCVSLKLETLIRRFIVVLQSGTILCSYIEMLQTYS